MSAEAKRYLSLPLFMVALVTLILAYSWGRELLAAHEALSWPTSRGVIQSTRIDRLRHQSFRPAIAYAYVAGGRTYEGSRISFGPGGNFTEQAARDIAGQFPPGAVDVHFDPLHPEDSVLLVDRFIGPLRPGFFWMGGIGLVCLTVGLGLLIQAERMDPTF